MVGKLTVKNDWESLSWFIDDQAIDLKRVTTLYCDGVVPIEFELGKRMGSYRDHAYTSGPIYSETLYVIAKAGPVVVKENIENLLKTYTFYAGMEVQE